MAEAQRTTAKLATELPHGFTILGPGGEGSGADDRSECESVTVKVWTTSDGRPCVEVVADREMSTLAAKGILHDALYALAHAGEVAVSNRT